MDDFPKPRLDPTADRGGRTQLGQSGMRHRTYAENQPLGVEAERAIDKLRERFEGIDYSEAQRERNIAQSRAIEDMPEPDRPLTSLELIEDELRRILMHARENRMMIELLNARASGETPESEGKDAAVRGEPAGQIARLHYLNSLASHELHRQSDELRKLSTVL
jgi:hypothetical protein